MKCCPFCTQEFESLEWRCPNCGWQPEKNNNIPIFSPETEHTSCGFKASSFALLASLEAQYFWFRVRNELITWALGKYGANISSFLEIGCGTGFVLQGIAKSFPKISLTGSDIYTEGLAFATERIRGGEFIQTDAEKCPFIGEFDAIGAFDVLEHIENDNTVLQQIFRSLKSYGLLLLTVPQHRWLWSKVDENACHMRRYTKRELHQKVSQAGFKILRSTSFVTSLLPGILLSRWMQRNKSDQAIGKNEFQINPFLNCFFEKILHLELRLIQKGISLPLGCSRLIAAQKQEYQSLRGER